MLNRQIDTDETILLEAGTPAWDAAWAMLAAEIVKQGLGDGGDLAQEHSHGEVWQYLSSFREGELVRHQFRHRQHPANGQRLLWTLPIAS